MKGQHHDKVPSSRRSISNPSESWHIWHGPRGSASRPRRQPPASWRPYCPVYPLSWEECACPQTSGSGLHRPNPKIAIEDPEVGQVPVQHCCIGAIGCSILLRYAQFGCFPALPEPNLTALSWVRFCQGFQRSNRVNRSPSPSGSDTAHSAPEPSGPVS